MSIAARVALGLAAGTVATIPMTAVMMVMRTRLPQERARQPVPVEVVRGASRVEPNLEREVNEHIAPVSLAGHFSYGAATGALYQIMPPALRQTGPLGGALYGMGVWAGSYLGYLPALAVRRSAADDPWQRNLTMILAHLAWGAALGMLSGPRRG